MIFGFASSPPNWRINSRIKSNIGSMSLTSSRLLIACMYALPAWLRVCTSVALARPRLVGAPGAWNSPIAVLVSPIFCKCWMIGHARLLCVVKFSLEIKLSRPRYTRPGSMLSISPGSSLLLSSTMKAPSTEYLLSSRIRFVSWVISS